MVCRAYMKWIIWEQLYKFQKLLKVGFNNIIMNANSREFEQAIRELNVKINQNAINDKLELEEILCHILCYPDRRKADLHHRSNNIGKNDLFEQQRRNEGEIKQNGLKNLKICECCGVLTNNDDIPYCTSLNKLNIGIGVHMFFTNYLFHALLFLLFFAIYSIYALVTNIQAYFQKTGSSTLCLGQGCSVSYIGAGSKLVSLKPESFDRMDTLNQIQCYIGIGFVTIWGFLYILKTYLQEKFVLKTEEKKIYASDFTLLLTHVPRQYFIKNYEKTAKIKSGRMNGYGKYEQNVHGQFSYLESNQILDKFNKQMIDYGRHRGSQYSYEVCKVNIAKPLYQKTQQQIKRDKKEKSQIKKKLNVLRGFIKQYKDHKQFVSKQKERDRAKQDAVSAIITSDYHQQGRKVVDFADDNVVFLTMKYSKALDEIQMSNRPPSIQNFWNCCRESDFPLRGVKVRRAPHPQQIKWESIGFPKNQKRLRRFVVWILTLVLIGISFGINVGISSQRKSGNIQNSIGISIAISIVISVINIGIQILVTLASYLENQYIMSRQQSSIALKVAFSQLVNSIGVPIFLQLIFYSSDNTNWLGDNGLVNDVFFIALINVAVPMALFFDPWEIYLRVVRWWYSRPMNRLYIHRQKQFNKLFGNYTFDIGYQYAYLIKTSVFTAFFVCMQPIIALFAPFGFWFYFLATKRNFLRHFQRPKYHFTTINKVVDVMLLFSLIAFGLGCLFVDNFIQAQFKNHYNSKLLYLNLIIVGIGLFFLIVVPLRLFYHFMKRPVSPQYDFKKQEPNITSDFDRLNPQTKQRAISEFKKLLEEQSKSQLGEQAEQNRNSLFLRQTQKRQEQEKKEIIANRMSKIHESLPRNDQTPDPVYNNNLEDYKEIINATKGQPHEINNVSGHQNYAPVPDSAQSHSGDQL